MSETSNVLGIFITLHGFLNIKYQCLLSFFISVVETIKSIWSIGQWANGLGLVGSTSCNPIGVVDVIVFPLLYQHKIAPYSTAPGATVIFQEIRTEAMKGLAMEWLFLHD